jgi:ribonuclease HI
MVAKKLKHYFEDHPITVVSTTPLSKIIGCKDATGRVAKWAIELAAHTIQYKPRTTIKSQILADFFADSGENQYLPPAPDSTYWRMNFDGSKMHGGLGAGIVLISPKGDKLLYALQIHFRASNNVAEYEALVHVLNLAKEIGIRRILCFRDSDLVVPQVSGEWDAKDANRASYRFYVQQLCGFFEGCEFHHIPRANNSDVDRLSKIGSTRQEIPAGVSLEIICKPSIKPSPESGSIYVPEVQVLAQTTLPDSGAAASELKEAVGQPSAAGSTKDSGAAVSKPPPQPAI